MGTGSLFRRKSGQGVELTTESLLAPKLRMGRTIKITWNRWKKIFFFFQFNTGELQNISWTFPNMSALVVELELIYESVPTQQRKRMLVDPFDQYQ